VTTFKSFHAKGSLPVKPPRDRRIVVATDASVCENGAALAYASSHGHYGLNAHPYPATMSGPARSTVCELRAILMALEAVLDEAAKMPVRVLTDSEAALSFLRKWKQGGADMPHGYSTYLRSSGGNSACPLSASDWFADTTATL
jgi:ribonuclease HI